MEPDTKSLPNGEQLAQTQIISASGESHELDYVMRKWVARGRRWTCWLMARSAGSRCNGPTSARLVARGGAQALIESLNQKTNDLSGGTLT